MAYTYRQMTNAEFESYVELMERPAVRRLYAVTGQASEDATLQRMNKYLEAFFQSLSAQEL